MRRAWSKLGQCQIASSGAQDGVSNIPGVLDDNALTRKTKAPDDSREADGDQARPARPRTKNARTLLRPRLEARLISCLVYILA